MDNPFNELVAKEPEVQPEAVAPQQSTIFDNTTPREAAAEVTKTAAAPVQAPFEVAPVQAPFEAAPVQAPFEAAPVQAPFEAAPVQQTAPFETVPVQQAAPVQQTAPFEAAPAPTPFDTPQQLIQQPIIQMQGGVNMQNQQGGQQQFGQQQQNTSTFGGNNFGGQQNQQPFGGGQQQQFGGGQQQQQTPKYHIIDMMWLINQKIIKKEQLQANERHILSVGTNASFGNMRMTFYDAGNNVFTPSSVIIANATRKTVANAYPEACNEILFNKENAKTVFLFERVIRANNSWTPNQTGITWAPNKITIQSMDSQNNQSLFEIVDWQVVAFEKALIFMTTGGGWIANLLGSINR